MSADDENHCRDCCCARSWAALGEEIYLYVGKSIPEYITDLRMRLEQLDSENDALREMIDIAERTSRENATLRAREQEARWLLDYKRGAYFRCNWDNTIANEKDWLARRVAYLTSAKEE